jgi:hypothetical protein
MAQERKYTKRVQCQYTDKQKQLIKCGKDEISAQMRSMEIKDPKIVNPHQKTLAYNIIGTMVDPKKIITMVVAHTQSGKTGSMYYTIKLYLEGSDNLIELDNIYIITGLSDKDWLNQTKERFPKGLRDRIFHRNQLRDTFVPDVRSKKNVLIIMDEVQVACKDDQTICKAFREAGLLDIEKLYENDVKILEYTATPNGTLYQLNDWGDAGSKIIAKAGDGYIGCYDLLCGGRVKKSKNICGIKKKEDCSIKYIIDDSILENINEIREDILSFRTPRYHIIRTESGKGQNETKKNFRRYINKDYNFLTYDQESNIEDINKVLSNEPDRHTFILIKEKLRCAKTLSKKYLGVLYERHTTCDDSSIVQGLLGRNTGYDVNSDSIVYTDIEAVKKYCELWDSEFTAEEVKWRSPTTYFKDGILKGKNTFNDLQLFDKTFKKEDKKEYEPTVMFFDSQEELKEYYKNVVMPILGGRGPNRVFPNKDGYYEATIRSKKEVYLKEKVISERKSGLSEKTKFRCYPCYRDIRDPDTLEWCLVYKN